MLRLVNVYAAYERIEVLTDISLEVREGELVCLLGANGAGKSTALRVISGLVWPLKGKVIFNGDEINGKNPEYIVRLGVSHVPEGRQIFSSLKVKQNLLLGTYAQKVGKGELLKRFAFIFELFHVLEEKIDYQAGNLSGGEQQMLAIARGLMSQPKMLLLDEPSLGLAPIIIKNIFQTILRLRSEGIPILIVEQNAKSALQVADRAYIVETGKIIKKGDAVGMLSDDEVRKRYLGR